MRKRVVLLIVIVVIIIVAAPIGLDWILVTNMIPTNIREANWVDFYGGYMGAIVGGVVSLAGIAITIWFTNAQNRAEREFERKQNRKAHEANVRPYCVLDFSFGKPRTKKCLATLAFGCDSELESEESRYDCFVYVKNIGIGSAVEFEIENEPIEDGRKHYTVVLACTSETLNNIVNHLQPEDEAYIGIVVFFNFEPIKEEDFYLLPNGEWAIKTERMTKYKNFNITLNIKYHDLYGNAFQQKAVLRSNMYFCGGGKKKTAIQKCDFCMTDATLPVRMNEKPLEKKNKE